MRRRRAFAKDRRRNPVNCTFLSVPTIYGYMIVDFVWVDRLNVRGLPWLLLLGFIPIGCVSLDKPNEVQTCSATGTCSDEPSRVPSEDAKKDIKSAPADLVNDHVGEGDAGQLNEKPDFAPEMATADLGNDDAAPDSVSVSGSIVTTATVAEDVAPDKSSPTEPANGPEPGPEPSMGPGPGPEPGPDANRESAPETLSDAGTSNLPPASNCTIFYGNSPPGGSAGQPPAVRTLSAFCIATCDDIDGWGCANFDGRTISVNGTTVSCGATLTKKDGYYVFRASAGTHSYATIYWWGPRASTCPSPPNGVFP